MKRKILLLTVLTLFIFSITACGSKSTEEGTDKILFNTKTINGQAIDSSIFKDNKITMVNIWTTWCSSCIAEMPDIQSLYEELKDKDVNIIGIIADTPDEEKEKLAEDIIERKGIKFENIIPDDKLNGGLLKDVMTFPTTFFVDSDGNIVGATFIGENDYRKEIMRLLENSKQN